MTTVLLDTNVVSYLLKGDTRATAYAPLIANDYLAISFMTVAELFEWAAIRKWGQTRLAQLEQTLATYLIIPVDVELCRLWGTLRAEQRAAGRTIASQDACIAATALRHHIPLITHNPSDCQLIASLEVRSIITQ
jgi:predicted nucleic acid-binding protein